MEHIQLKGVSQAQLDQYGPCSAHSVNDESVVEVKAAMALLGYKTNDKPAPVLVCWNGPAMYSEEDHVVFLRSDANRGLAMHELTHAFSVKPMHIIKEDEIEGFVNPKLNLKSVVAYAKYLSAPAELEAHAIQFMYEPLGQWVLSKTKNRYAIKAASMYWICATLVQEKILNRI